VFLLDSELLDLISSLVCISLAGLTSMQDELNPHNLTHGMPSRHGMPSCHNLALAATLLALFAVNTEAGNMCKDPAHLAYDDGRNVLCPGMSENCDCKTDCGGPFCKCDAALTCCDDDRDFSEVPTTCERVNQEIEAKLPSDKPAGYEWAKFQKFDEVDCAMLCGPEGAAALQLMYANPSCCGGAEGRDRLLCHSSDGTCDPAECGHNCDTGDATLVILLFVIFCLGLCCCGLCCHLAGLKGGSPPEGAGHLLGTLYLRGRGGCCGGDSSDWAAPPYSFAPAGDCSCDNTCYCFNAGAYPEGLPAQCCLPLLLVFLLALCTHSLFRFLVGIPVVLSVNTLGHTLSPVLQVHSGRQHGPSWSRSCSGKWTRWSRAPTSHKKTVMHTVRQYYAAAPAESI
jgi:hypothetical protein